MAVQIKRIIGDGAESVYAYSFRTMEHAEVWLCKIGRSAGNPAKRILGQQASMHVAPVIDLLIKTDNSIHVERVLHFALAAKKLPTFGDEWFLTNPGEIEAALSESESTGSIGEAIRLARLKRGLSQAQLGQLAGGIRQATISKLESNPRKVMFDVVERVVKALDMKIVVSS